MSYDDHEVPEGLSLGELDVNRDGLVRALYDDLDALMLRYQPKMSRVELLGTLESIRVRLIQFYVETDDED